MNKAYQRINWQNKPETATPTGATNFNKMDKAIDDIDNRVVEINGSIESMQVAISGKASATALSDEVTARQNADSSLLTTLNNHSTQINNKYDKVYTNGTDGTLTDSDNGLLKNLMVKGKCEQTTFNGYNLINTFAYTRRDGITQISSDGVITVNNNLSGQIAGISFNYSSLPSGQYIFKNYSNVGYYVMFNSSDYSHYISPNQSYAITKEDYLNLQGANIPVDATVTFKCMLESGTVAHDYEQYCGGIPSPNPTYPQTIKKVTSAKVVVRGKNLYDAESYPLTFNKAIDSSNGSVYDTSSNNWYATEAYIPFEYVGKNICKSVTNKMTICFYDSNKQVIGSMNSNIETILVPSGTKYIRFDVYKDYYDVAQIELGTSATSYEAYTEQSVSTNLTLYGIGSTCDYIDVARGKVVRKIGVDVFNSTSGLTNYADGKYAYNNYSKYKYTNPLALCNYLKNALDTASVGNLYISEQYINMNFGMSETELNAKLSANPLIIVAELLTPTETDLDATVLAQLRALTSYYPSTNLVITSDEINGTSNFDYPLNLESFIKSIQNGVQALNEALEG